MSNPVMPKWILLAALLLGSTGLTTMQPALAQEAPAPVAGESRTVDRVVQTGQTAEPEGSLPATASDNGAGPELDLTDPLADAADTPAADATLPHDLSPLGMFLAADIVVKGVMIGLALASVATWAILIAKLVEIAGAKHRIKRAVRLLTDATVLRDVRDELGERKGPAGQMVAAAGEELAKSEATLDIVPTQGVKERVASRLTRIEAGAGKKIASGTGILATIGSISPFVGLFGTVWGIMNSFIGISQAQTTNLAIVAPGIAEALLATAIGLVAAIPAVVIYNYFARSIGGYRLLLADASAAVERLVSRDLDFRAARRQASRRPDLQPHQVDAAIARIG
ncbi:tonB-system energizer ExbB [Pararhizobium antarcticum]|uniref:Biopolymer transport protein ExbB n=1 Tax=Pararhizobium antarcticum TaxID=1798805 RepID=A0A657LJV8_9HYPH|nr:tonB-system energizer ExbB [Pararhizobium antarcticum]OJF89966.1 biopolymer transport protein ExbB [Pararhizobium antarcticum]OJF93201.1 biopolymer transport protein ExbB [Rhizobium sp. 58]